MFRINVLNRSTWWKLDVFKTSIIQRRRDLRERRQKLYGEFTLGVKAPELMDFAQLRKSLS
jgi:hypothetical protein